MSLVGGMICILYSFASALSHIFQNLWHERSSLDSASLIVGCHWVHSIARAASAKVLKAALQHSLCLGLFHLAHQAYELTGLGSCSGSSQHCNSASLGMHAGSPPSNTHTPCKQECRGQNGPYVAIVVVAVVAAIVAAAAIAIALANAIVYCY